jgi:hypothetical protein
LGGAETICPRFDCQRNSDLNDPPTTLLLAFVADAVDLEAVPRGEIVELLADLLLQLLQFRSEEFHRTTAFRADHVVMAAAVVLVLVARDAVVEGDFAGESAFGEKFQRPVNGGKADLRVFFADLAVKLIGREMIALLEKGLQDGVALVGVLQPNPLEVLVKDIGRLAEHLPRDRRLVINSFRKHVRQE